MSPTPKDPFCNVTENHAYRTDYRTVLPSLYVPGSEVPLYPEWGEKRAIRSAMNIAGLCAVLHIVGSYVIFFLCRLLLISFMRIGTPEDIRAAYTLSAAESQFLQNSTVAIALNALIYMALNLGLGFLGIRNRSISPAQLVAGRTPRIGRLIAYAGVGIFINTFFGMLYALLDSLLRHFGIVLETADFEYFNTPKSTVVVLLYLCLIAPVTEEFLYRGFMMKSLSLVSVRFGMIASALLFGMMHGNLKQAVIGFFVGLFLAKIDVRHNSILPSVFVHAVMNSYVALSMAADHFFPAAVNQWIGISFYLIAMAGFFYWVLRERRRRFPIPTQKQIIRTRLMWSSPLFLCAFLAAAGVMVYQIVQSLMLSGYL